MKNGGVAVKSACVASLCIREGAMIHKEATQADLTATPPFFIFQRDAVIIANPTSGSYIFNRRQLEETMSFLRDYGWKVELKLTQVAGDARLFAREAVAEKVDVVIAAGGDGTIN